MRRHNKTSALNEKQLKLTDSQIDSAILHQRQLINCWCIVGICALIIAIICGFGVYAIVGNSRTAAAISDPQVTPMVSHAASVSPSEGETEAVHDPTLDEVVPIAYSNLGAVNGEASLATLDFALTDQQTALLTARIDDFLTQGYQASFVVVDMSDGGVVSSNGGEARYSASSIKAPYILSLAQTGALDLNEVVSGNTANGIYLRNLIIQTLQVSDNDSYVALYERFGSAPAIEWFESAGVTEDLDGYYADMTALDVARMWVQGYQFLFGQTATDGEADSRAWLAEQMQGSLNSTISEALAEKSSVYSKAGWIDGLDGLYAFNDAGIVIPSDATDLNEHPQGYVLAILTNACERHDLLTQLAQAVDEVMNSR